LHTEIKACRACHRAELLPLLDLGQQALTGVFPHRRDEKVSSGPLQLVKCGAADGCGLVQLRHSFDLAEMYGMNYGYRSGLNASMVRHLESKVSRVLASGVLRDGDLVIDIGSNDATTLKAYPQGRYELVGIDPTGVKFADYYPSNIRLIPEFFSADLVASGALTRKARVITSFSMFYDLEDPVDFMRQIESVLDNDGIWVFEQSYLPAMLDTRSFDTVCHEHLEFYALKQICWMAERAGLRVIDVEFNDVNGGSFSVTAAKTGSSIPSQAQTIERILEDERRRGLDGADPFVQFRKDIEQARSDLLGFLRAARAEGKRVVGLGASTKGNVLLQHFGIDESLLDCIAEVNSDKFGAFTPGTLIPIRPESEVLSENPDYLLVLPWHFRPFFMRLSSMAGRKLVFPLPRLETVTVERRGAGQ
jgi:hypothetical protein